jgi:hypothetical protein
MHAARRVVLGIGLSLVLGSVVWSAPANAALSRLKVSENRRFLVSTRTGGRSSTWATRRGSSSTG